MASISGDASVTRSWSAHLASRAVQVPVPGSDLESPSRRGKAAQRRADRLVVCRERIAFGQRRRVVLGGASAVIRDLLVEQIAFAHRRSEGNAKRDGCRDRRGGEGECLPRAQGAVTGEGRRDGARDGAEDDRNKGPAQHEHRGRRRAGQVQRAGRDSGQDAEECREQQDEDDPGLVARAGGLDQAHDALVGDGHGDRERRSERRRIERRSLRAAPPGPARRGTTSRLPSPAPRLRP